MNKCNETIFLASSLLALLSACTSGTTQTSSSQPITYAYIVNNGSNNYTQCSVGANGINTSSCTMITPSGSGALNQPLAIAINNGIAYITNSAESGYTQCTIVADNQSVNGVINPQSCLTTRGVKALSVPIAIAVSNGFAYILNQESQAGQNVPVPGYVQCAVNANGIESSTCSAIVLSGNAILDAPTGVAVSNGFAYFSNNGANASYTQCAVNANGIESSSCTTITPSGNAALNGPAAIAISNNYAYITNLNDFSYTQCAINGSGIIASSCTTVVPLGTPSGSGILASPAAITVSNGYAYITNWLNTSYTQCSVNSNGLAANSCTTIIPSQGIFNIPYGIAIY